MFWLLHSSESKKKRFLDAFVIVKFEGLVDV